MSLLYPETLWYLLGIVPLLVLLTYGYRSSRRRLSRLTGAWRSGSVYDVFLVKSFFQNLLLLLFVLFAILAASGFTWGRRTVEDERSGVDLVFAVDISRSMLAEDITPSRIGRARDAMRGAIRELGFSRFSVVVFRGDAVTAIPMTEDSVAVENFLSALSVRIMTSPGTDLAAGLRQALNAFPTGGNRHRMVVLFSDGERVGGGEIGPVIAEAVREEVAVFTVAAGSESGARIPLGDGNFVTDEEGDPVVSRVRAATLRRIAAETGGEFFSFSEGNSISALLRALQERHLSVSEDGLRTESVERYRTFLVLALLFLFLYTLLGALRWRNLF
ncbi:MAG: vWA domain-containing protein [Spirochaetaceae bacterium]